MAYAVQLTIEADEFLKQLSAFHRKSIIAEIEQHLVHQPTTVSRSRIKKLQQPAISQYRLRVGEFRIFYDVDEDANLVTVLRVWEKGRGVTPEVESS